MWSLHEKLVMTVLAGLLVVWAAGFVRRAVRTLRFGTPFTINGRMGGEHVEARFGRIGAVFVTAVVVAMAGSITYAVAAVWLEDGR